MNIKSSIGRSKNVSSVALGQYRCRSDIAVRIDCTRLQVPGRQIRGYCSECYNAYASQAPPRARLYVTQPLGLCLSVYRQAPNRQQAPALVKWSWRPFWGCRRYDKSRPVASRGGSGRIAWARPGLSFMSAPWGLSWNAMRKRRVASIWAISSWRAIMKKLSMLGIIVGAALLSAAPFSLQWSQKDVALSLDSADARVGRPLTATSVAGVHRRAHRRAYRRGYYY